MLLIVLPITTSVKDQGIYYALLGIFSLFAFTDLGLSSALVNFISHQKESNSKGRDQENLVKRANLGRLIMFAFFWGIFGSLILGVLTYFIGVLSLNSFFASIEDLHYSIILISIMSIFFFQMLIFFSILEGLNLVAKMFFYRSFYMFLLITSQVVFLFLDYSYKSLAYAQMISTIVIYILVLFKYFNQFLSFALQSKKEANISIFHDVLPFQYKVALSWIFGFIPIQIMPTLIASSLGLAWSAKIGMTQQIVTAISATAFVFVQIIVPKMGQLVSERQNLEAIKIYKKSLKLSLGISILGILGFTFFYFIIQNFYEVILDRILPPDLLILFFSLIFVNWITFARAALARVFHVEVMFWPTIFGGTVIMFLLIVSKFLTPNEFVYYYITIAWISCIFFGGLLFKRFISGKVFHVN